MQRKDIIISSASGYKWGQLECWAKSIKKSGFAGDAYLILYDDDPEIVAQLKNLGVNVFKPITDHLGCKKPDVVVDRFYQKWVLINSIGHDKIHRVISTDIHDVIFQTDPTLWLDEHLDNYKLFITSEGIAYKNETWGKENFRKCFGEEIWGQGIAESTIFNCGVWGGISEYAADMFLLVYLIGFGHPIHSQGQRPGTRWTDQASLNLISGMSLIKDKIKFIKSEDGFAAQLGTFLAANNDYCEHLNEPRPVFKNGEVFTASGKKYAIVHQYNRVPELREQIRDKYR